MLESWKALCQGNLDRVEIKYAYPLMRWMSGNPKNLSACSFIDGLFFHVQPKMVISLLHANCSGGFFKYPKSGKEKLREEEELIKKYLCQIYGWSELEYNKNKGAMFALDIARIGNFINEKIGLDKKEAKILGVEYVTTKQKFIEKPKQSAGLSMFGL